MLVVAATLYNLSVRLSFRERVIEPEWLDRVGAEEARDSLADLVRLNRNWGGYSSLARLLNSAGTPADRFSVLDVGAASGDMGRQIQRLRPGAVVTSLDYVAHHLDAAPLPKVVGDAFHLPFSGSAFDYVFSSLFLHHFTNTEVVQLLQGFRAVARRGVLIVDLERRTIPYYFLTATRWLLRWDALTVHDGPISVAAGFRAQEMHALATAAGFRDVEVRTHGVAYRVTLRARV